MFLLFLSVKGNSVYSCVQIWLIVGCCANHWAPTVFKYNQSMFCCQIEIGGYVLCDCPHGTHWVGSMSQTHSTAKPSKKQCTLLSINKQILLPSHALTHPSLSTSFLPDRFDVERKPRVSAVTHTLLYQSALYHLPPLTSCHIPCLSPPAKQTRNLNTLKWLPRSFPSFLYRYSSIVR